MIALSIKNVSFSYDGKQKVFDNVSLDVQKGDVAAITGASGSGKSTLAMVACGVIPKAVHGFFSGSVSVFGEDTNEKQIYETAEKISMVFQEGESQLFAPVVADEVAFTENLCYAQEEIIVRINQALQTVGMQSLIDYAPTMLSGGQQQLIALASILSLDPDIIILDEVAAQIDETGVRLIKEAVGLLKKQGKTLLIIEHGTALKEFYDQVYSFENGTLLKAGNTL